MANIAYGHDSDGDQIGVSVDSDHTEWQDRLFRYSY